MPRQSYARSILTTLAVVCALSAPYAANAGVRAGPYPATATSSNGALIWYVGVLDLQGRHWRDLDQICQSVPVRQVSGWRAPTEAELRTLITEVPRQNAVTRCS
jgi:hypothetical protein